MMRELEVVAAGPQSTVQDLGRPGRCALGVGRSGAADRSSLRLGNRLLGNLESAAGIETTLGGLVVRAHGELLVAVTGAPCPVTVDGRQAAPNGPVRVRDGAQVRLGTPVAGLRSYLCVRGGVSIPPVLGSRSWDVMARLGPDPLRPGHLLPVGCPLGPQPNVEHAVVARAWDDEMELRVTPGPRDDWFTPQALDQLTTSTYQVTAESDRVGMRLNGPALERSRDDELPSEGMVRGALQVPPSGRPTLFLADHPVTGGYPVIAVVLSTDVDLAAQARPGARLRFRQTSGPLTGLRRMR